ncbi:MAG: glycosyltransferase family 39 protein [Anaerolineae bacterium]|nr:glycosyltransferase family 39 protein [Anaerolineae bacterium]
MRKKRDGIIILILWLAMILRVYGLGLWVTWGDELNIINAAVAITQRGDWTWLGNEASFGALAAHSPFSVYVTALPTLISPHPLLIRSFYALLGLVTGALMYGMMRRYVGWTAAVIAASLLAVMPLPVDWSRYVWNPNLAPIFILIWLLTAAEGYFRGRTWGQYIHWIAVTAQGYCNGN